MAAHFIAEEGPLQGLVLDFKEGNLWIIGRDPDQTDYVLEDATVSRKHAEISLGDEGFFIKNLSRINPTLINEEEFTGKTLLKEGDRVRIGQTLFLFSEESSLEDEKTEEKKNESSYDNIFSSLEEPEEFSAEENEPDSESEVEPEARNAYDTIFEESEEEVPFHLIGDTPLLLKVISGPNAGAEIGLEKNKTYLIGKDPNSCEIVFQDLSVSRNHAKLTIDSEGIITIEDLHSKNGTRLNGVLIEELKHVTSQDLIACGTTTFVILDKEAAQETIYSPAYAAFEEVEPEEEVEEEPEEEVLPTDWKESIIPTKYIALAIGGVVTLLIVFLSFFSLFKSQKMEVVTKKPVEKIHEALKKYNDVEFSYNPATGKLFLTGHVLTKVDQQELLYDLKALPFIYSVEDNIIIDEYIWKNINDVLVENADWKGINVYATEAGHFIISGYLATNEEKDNLDDYLNTHFPFLDKLENKVYVEQNLTMQVQAILQSNGLDGILFQLNNGALTLSGFFNEKENRKYQDTVAQLEEIPGIRSVQNIAVGSSESSARINLTANYQITGYAKYDSNNYSVVINGQILTLGDSLDGMDITSIQKNMILLEKDGLKYKIDYNP
ncbi:MAG: type III secretion system inner membrane ring subunit SctD [Chlamydiota bacterium]|jgi:type III secretion system YscD/HrpQ family protein